MGLKEKPDIVDIIERKMLQWYGHVKRMQEERLPKLIMEWIPGERRKRGRLFYLKAQFVPRSKHLRFWLTL